MQICLVNSNYCHIPVEMKVVDEDFKIKLHFSETGLLSLGSILEKYNYQVKLVDLGWLVTHGRLELNNSYHSEAARLIVNQNIPVLGFNTRCDTYPSVINIAKKCKQLNPDSMIIFGGHQATFTDIETLNTFPFVDIVVRGEGELTLLDLMNHIKDKKELFEVDGITYRHNGQVIRNKQRVLIEDLDSLPLPAYHLMSDIKYKKLFKKHRIPISVGKGCPFKCSFCVGTLMDRQYYRMRKPENIIKEIKFLKQEYGVNRFFLGHDNLLAKRKPAEEMCHSFIENNIDIRWSCFSRIETIDASFLELLSKAGCEEISFGIDSGSPRMQKIIKKNLRLGLVSDVIKECHKHNISTVTSFIVGFPEEKQEDINLTLNMALNLARLPRNVIHHHLFSPMAGTFIYRQNIDSFVYLGLLSDIVLTPLISLEENLNLIKKFSVIFSTFYMPKPKYLPQTLPYELATNLFNLILYYCNTFQIALNALNFTPLKLLQMWGEYIQEKGNRLRCFPVFLKAIYKEKNLPFESLERVAESERLNLWQMTKIKQYLKDLKKNMVLP